MVRRFIALALLLFLVVLAFANDYDFVLTPIPSPTEEVTLSPEAKKEFADNDRKLPHLRWKTWTYCRRIKKSGEVVLGMHGAFNPFQIPIADAPMYYADSLDMQPIDIPLISVVGDYLFGDGSLNDENWLSDKGHKNIQKLKTEDAESNDSIIKSSYVALLAVKIGFLFN